LAAFDDDAEGAVVEGFGGVVADLGVVGVGAAVDEEAGELGMVSDAGGGVENALELGLRLVRRTEEAGVGVRAGVEQGGRGAHESVRAPGIEEKVFGEAEVGQGVPAVGSADGGGVGGIGVEEAPDGDVVAQDGGNEDVGGGDRGVGGENGSCGVEGAVPDGRVEEGGARVGGGGHGFEVESPYSSCGSCVPGYARAGRPWPGRGAAEPHRSIPRNLRGRRRRHLA
jgi:hypothetical protein